MAALTPSELVVLRDDLIRARAGGAREVRDQNGETIIFKSDAEMKAAIADLEARIAASTSTAPNVIRFRATRGV